MTSAWKPGRLQVSIVVVFLTAVFAFANVDPKKGRVTANPTSGNPYSLEREVDYRRQAIPEIEKVSAFTPGSGGKELGEGTRQLIASIRDTNPGLRQTGNPVNSTVGGRAAKSFEILGESAIQEKGHPIPERSGWSRSKGRAT